MLVPRVRLGLEGMRPHGCLVGTGSGRGINVGLQIIFSHFRSEDELGKMTRLEI